jgi:hypothetical protein
MLALGNLSSCQLRAELQNLGLKGYSNVRKEFLLEGLRRKVHYRELVQLLGAPAQKRERSPTPISPSGIPPVAECPIIPYQNNGEIATDIPWVQPLLDALALRFPFIVKDRRHLQLMNGVSLIFTAMRKTPKQLRADGLHVVPLSKVYGNTKSLAEPGFLRGAAGCLLRARTYLVGESELPALRQSSGASGALGGLHACPAHLAGSVPPSGDSPARPRSWRRLAKIPWRTSQSGS